MKKSLILLWVLIIFPGVIYDYKSSESEKELAQTTDTTVAAKGQACNQNQNQECAVPVLECPNTNITYYLYANGGSPVLVDEAKIQSININPQRPVKLLIHGYRGHKDDNFNKALRRAYQKRGDYNIISVDYAPLVKEPCYEQGALNTQLVAVCVANFVDLLAEKRGLRMDALHIVGFDFGAHVAGLCTNCLRGRIGRITGLDPSLSMFTDEDTTMRLDSDDAIFVDVIHTNAGRLGHVRRLGDVDFYINGGIVQPGCERASDMDLCSHYMAPVYFSESITTPHGFWGMACKDACTRRLGLPKAPSAPKVPMLMGEDVSVSAYGTMCVDTMRKSPFAKGRCEMKKSQTFLYDLGGIVMVVIVLYFATKYFFFCSR